MQLFTTMASTMNQDIRWKQRFYNLEKAFLFLERASKQRSFNELEAAGLVQSFEFTFELTWKTLKGLPHRPSVYCSVTTRHH
jgi:hypothetical protein